MASSHAVGGVRKKLTLQTKKRYQLSSSTSTKQPSCDEKSKSSATRCDDALRKRLYSYCVPTSNEVSPLPASTLIGDVKTEAKPNSHTLPPPNLELLTRKSFAPLDLKKCLSEPVIVIDDTSDTPTQKFRPPHKQQHVGVAAPLMQHGRTPHDHVMQKGVSSTHNALLIQTNAAPVEHQKDMKSNSHYTQQRKPSFINKHYLQPSHAHKLDSVSSHKSHPDMSTTTTIGGETSAGTYKQQSCHKRTWSEVNDVDDEFDELCQMVDLSNSFDDNELYIAMTTESNSINKDDNTWTCPMCDQVFIGSCAEDHENHLVQCLAMDVV